jgi:hypothetical protein
MESGFLSVSIFFVIDGKTVNYLIGSAVFFQPVYKSGLLVAFERKKNRMVQRLVFQKRDNVPK